MRYITTAAAALVLCVLLGAVISAQTEAPSLEVLFQKAASDVARADARVQQWSRDAQVSWMVVVVIVVLGILTAAVQALTFKTKGFVTAVIGGLVSGATVYSAATLPADYKTLNNLVSEGTELVAAAKGWLDKPPASVSDRLFALNDIATVMRRFDDLDITKKKPAAPAAAPAPKSSLFMPVVHAAGRESSAPLKCDCAALMGRGSRGAGELLACATATGATLTEAYQRAVAEAATTLGTQLRGRMKTQAALPTEQVVGFVQQFATEEGSCRGTGKTAEMSVVLRLPESLGNEAAIAAFATRGSAARLKVPAIKVIHDGSTGDTGWKFDVLVDGRVVGQIQARDYTDKPAAQATVHFSGTAAIEIPVEMPKSNYWLVEIKGQRTRSADTAIGAAAVNGMDKPVEIVVANPVATNGSFVFTVSLDKK